MHRARGETCRLLATILKNEDRHFMLAHLIDQVRARSLSQVSDAPADQRELRTLQLRQIEAEGNLALEPRLHRVAVRGDDVDRSCAGQGTHMQVSQFAVNPLPEATLA